MGKCWNACKRTLRCMREIGHEYVAKLYLFLMLGILPLVLHNGYIDYAETKFIFFLCASLLCMGIALFCGVSSDTEQVFLLRKKTVICYFLFLISGGVSALLADAPLRAFWGSEGRYCGLLTYLLLGVGIWIVAKGNGSVVYLYLLEIVACVVAFLGIMNHYYEDPLGVYFNLVESEHGYFSSTLGGMVNVGDFLAIMFVVGAMLFCLTKETARWSIVHFLTMLSCETAIILNGADGAYIGVFVFLFLSPFIWKNRKEVICYLEVVSVLLGTNVVLECLGILGIQEKETTGVGTLLRHQWQIFIVILIINTFLLLYLKRKDAKDFILGRKWKKIYAVGLSIVIVLGVTSLILVNAELLHLSNESLQKWLLITDEWGNGRGYIWREVWKGYWELPILKKIFGIGPTMLWQWSFTRVSTVSYIVEFDHAHNMFLHFLMTHGLVGSLAWFGWLFGTLTVGLKKAKQEPLYYALAGGLLTYLGVGMVGVNMLTITVIANIFSASIIGREWKKVENTYEWQKALRLFIVVLLILLLALTLESNGYLFVKQMIYQ